MGALLSLILKTTSHGQFPITGSIVMFKGKWQSTGNNWSKRGKSLRVGLLFPSLSLNIGS
jgi:hypothetical protein